MAFRAREIKRSWSSRVREGSQTDGGKPGAVLDASSFVMANDPNATDVVRMREERLHNFFFCLFSASSSLYQRQPSSRLVACEEAYDSVSSLVRLVLCFLVHRGLLVCVFMSENALSGQLTRSR